MTCVVHMHREEGGHRKGNSTVTSRRVPGINLIIIKCERFKSNSHCFINRPQYTMVKLINQCSPQTGRRNIGNEQQDKKREIPSEELSWIKETRPEVRDTQFYEMQEYLWIAESKKCFSEETRDENYNWKVSSKESEQIDNIKISNSTDGSFTVPSREHKLGKDVWFKCSIIVISIGILVALTVLIATTRWDLNDANPPSDTTSIPPATSSPTGILPGILPELVAALQNKDSILLSLPAESPQRKALTWMLTQDQGYFNDFAQPNKILERYILAVFYFATDGPRWDEQCHFLSDLSVCLWNEENAQGQNLGVHCDDDGSVGMLYHTQWPGFPAGINTLVGTVPTELGLFTSMSKLALGGNDLTGSIPTELGLLTSLTFLDFRKTKLIGKIPTELGNLKKFEKIILYENSLSGAIPSELGYSTNLDWIILNNNRLSGSIPNELCQLSKLEKLWLHSNLFTGKLPCSFSFVPRFIY